MNNQNQDTGNDNTIFALDLTQHEPIFKLHLPSAPIFDPEPIPTISSDLASKLTGDVVVAFGLTFTLSPFLTVIDKAIVQTAAGSGSIVQSSLSSMTKMAANPVAYFKSPMFLLMWGVYASTYTTANCLKTITEHRDHFHVNQRDSRTTTTSTNTTKNNITSETKFGIFAATTVINSSMSLLKDRYYASHFGKAASTSKVLKIPKITYGLWGLRDCMVIGSSFILPDIMTDVLSNHTDLDKTTAKTLSQFSCPILAQTVTGPVQLLGLDIYNRPLPNSSAKEVFMERCRFQYNNFRSIVSARICRIAPAYGIGGVGNTYFRDMWREKLLRKEQY